MFTYIEIYYGEATLEKIKKLEKIMITYALNTNHLQFFTRFY